MSYGRALLARDLNREREKLSDEQDALSRKAGRKSLWGTVGGTLGGLAATALTGGAAAPWVAAMMAGAGTAAGGVLGQKASGVGKIDPKSISKGKFLRSSRDDVVKDFKNVDRDLLEGALVGGLKSGLTAGAGQYLKLGVDAKKAEELGSSAAEIAKIKKGVGLGESVKSSWGAQSLAKGKDFAKDFAGDLSTGFKNTSFDQTTLPDGMSFKDYQSLVAERQGSYAASEAAKTFDFSTLNKDNSVLDVYRSQKYAGVPTDSVYTPTRDANLGGRGTNAFPLDNFNIKNTINKNRNLIDYSWDSKSIEGPSMINALEYERPSWQEKLFESIGLNDFRNNSTYRGER